MVKKNALGVDHLNTRSRETGGTCIKESEGMALVKAKAKATRVERTGSPPPTPSGAILGPRRALRFTYGFYP